MALRHVVRRLSADPFPQVELVIPLWREGGKGPYSADQAQEKQPCKSRTVT